MLHLVGYISEYRKYVHNSNGLPAGLFMNLFITLHLYSLVPVLRFMVDFISYTYRKEFLNLFFFMSVNTTVIFQFLFSGCPLSSFSVCLFLFFFSVVVSNFRFSLPQLFLDKDAGGRDRADFQ